MALIDKLTAIADAIRGKTGKAEEMTLDQMVTEIASISGGGGGNGADIAENILNRTITEYSNSNITLLRHYAFYSCSNLSIVSVPNVKTFEDNVFGQCTKLTSVNAPSLTAMWKTVFMNCRSLRFADLGHIGTINAQSFYDNKVLERIILRKTDGVANLVNTNAFVQTPFASGGTGGTVYVPKALISQYQQATNWSTLYAAGTCNFVAIEGSEYE